MVLDMTGRRTAQAIHAEARTQNLLNLQVPHPRRGLRGASAVAHAHQKGKGMHTSTLRGVSAAGVTLGATGG